MKLFLESNPGLKSRFNKEILFEDYSEYELLSIFEAFCKPYGMQLHPEAEQYVSAYLSWLVTHKDPVDQAWRKALQACAEFINKGNEIDIVFAILSDDILDAGTKALKEVAPQYATAVKGDWQTSEMPTKHDTFILDRCFTPEQMKALRKGNIPQEMEDKWFSGNTSSVNLPAFALEEMEQKIECDNCGAHYAVVGSAFYRPCCGKNSAKLTFNNTINKVRSKIKNIPLIYNTVAVYSKDEAERTCTSLIESSISDLVVAFQRVCECVYPQIDGAKPIKKNVFQRLNDGNTLWEELTGEGYHDWITPAQYKQLVICFQQRHLLQHQDGIVDQEYISKSGKS